jgi:hypothetical protein
MTLTRALVLTFALALPISWTATSFASGDKNPCGEKKEGKKDKKDKKDKKNPCGGDEKNPCGGKK